MSVHTLTRLKSRPAAPAVAAPTLAEVFSPQAADGAATGFVLSRLPRGAPVLWARDRLTAREAGGLYVAGLPAEVLQADLSDATAVLRALEEGLRCAALGAVVGEIWGDPPALDFTATKRLALRCEAGGVACWLIRRGGAANLSAARERWRVASLPSAPNPDDPRAPGDPRWRVELFRARDGRPGTWVACHDRAADRVDLAPLVPDGAVAALDGAAGQSAFG